MRIHLIFLLSLRANEKHNFTYQSSFIFSIQYQRRCVSSCNSTHQTTEYHFLLCRNSTLKWIVMMIIWWIIKMSGASPVMTRFTKFTLCPKRNIPTSRRCLSVNISISGWIKRLQICLTVCQFFNLQYAVIETHRNIVWLSWVWMFKASTTPLTAPASKGQKRRKYK